MSDHTVDDFNGNDGLLIQCIDSLLAMDAKGILVPHEIGGHARTLLKASKAALEQAAQSEQSERKDKPAECVNGCPDKQVCDYCQSAAAIMPCGASVTNVYEAYDAGKKAAQSVPPKPDYSVTQLQRMKSLMGVLGLATDESLEAFCLDADRQLSRVITAMEKFMAKQSVPVVGEVVAYTYQEEIEAGESSARAGRTGEIGVWHISKQPQCPDDALMLYLKPTHSITAAELDEIASLTCPKSYGFEGPETFPDCGECVVCRMRKLKAAIAAEGEK